VADFIQVLLNQFLGFYKSLGLETVVRMKFYFWLDPELGLALGMLHMHVRPRFLAREEVEPEPLDAQDRRTHSDRIA
jgi:hypothetical protein